MAVNGYRFKTVSQDLIFNNERMAEATRMVDIGPVFGVACHTCTVVDGMLESQHRGMALNAADAQRWLDGEDVDLKRVYGNPDGR